MSEKLEHGVWQSSWDISRNLGSESSGVVLFMSLGLEEEEERGLSRSEGAEL